DSYKVVGLESGADYYLAKPFSTRELLARVRAQVRGARGQAGPAGEVLRVGGLEIDAGAHTAHLDGKPLSLTATELALLSALARRPGRVLSREQLLEASHSGGSDEAFDRAVDVSI